MLGRGRSSSNGILGVVCPHIIGPVPVIASFTRIFECVLVIGGYNVL
jgi:hypothetical protein